MLFALSTYTHTHTVSETLRACRRSLSVCKWGSEDPLVMIASKLPSSSLKKKKGKKEKKSLETEERLLDDSPELVTEKKGSRPLSLKKIKKN